MWFSKERMGFVKDHGRQHGIFWRYMALIILVLTVLLLGYALANRYVCVLGDRIIFLTADPVDLRSEELSLEDYQKISAKNPPKTVLWNVPMGETGFDSGSTALVLDSLAESDVPMFAFFPDLKSIDAEGCTDYAALTGLEEAYPDLDVQWSLHIGGKSWKRDVGSADLRGLKPGLEELENTLGYFEPHTRIYLDETSLTPEEAVSLRNAFTELEIGWDVPLSGVRFSTQDRSLSFPDGQVDIAALTAAADQFACVEEIDLGEGSYTLPELAELQNAFCEAHIHGSFELLGIPLTTDMEQIDLSGIPMEDTALVEQAVALMPNLKKVVMCGCGISSEEMDALGKRHPQTRFVWSVKIGRATVRTDITGFIGAKYGYLPDARIRDPQKDKANRLFDEDCGEFKYCTDIVVMDLGHMGVTDYSFLEYMPNLQYLILADTPGTDFSVLEKLDNLIFLELFMTKFTQTEQLLGLKKLESLNLADTDLEDPELLAQMPWLEMLWLPGTYLPNETYEMLEAALPNTTVSRYMRKPYDFTGNGWRKSQNYYDMRDLLGMYYLN